VFLKHDYTFMPDSVLKLMKAEYRQLPSDELDIYVNPQVAGCLGL